MFFKSDTRKSVYRLIDAERRRQDNKWANRRQNSTSEWMMILGEEYGEACQAGCDIIFSQSNDRSRLVDELVQVAAVAVAILENELGKQN